MGIVMQAQRRAIEGLAPQKKGLPDGISDAEIYLDGGKRVYILGVSPGQGTCSDVHDMDVLVLSSAKPESGPRTVPGSSIETCQYAVLLRSPTKKEVRKAQGYLCATSLLALELLEVAEDRSDKVIFKPTRRVECYAQFA
ncbi:hypothetical protein KJ885_04330 [Patescibacteria group bacterium]|nr:hypothetical protein [Patescibacteria group bacterium]